MKMRLPAPLLLIALVACSTLVNKGWFGPETLAAYLLYNLSVSLLCLACGVRLLNSGRRFPAIRLLPFMFFGLLIIFLYAGALLHTGEMNPHRLLLLSDFLLLAACSLLIGAGQVKPGQLLFLIAGLAIAEAVVCLLQFAGIMSAQNSLFAVTGTWVNPNVTAMFLAMSTPAAWVLALQKETKAKRTGIVALGFIFLAFLLLKCRTAVIGAGLISAIILYRQQAVKARLSRLTAPGKAALLAAGLLVAIPAVFYMYKSKQASADGRSFIWKISADMIARKPLAGYGLGMFEREYNLFQAGYFNSGKAGTEEIYNASFVHMAYNDFLELAIEGGIIALLLWLFFLASLLLPPGKNRPGADPDKQAPDMSMQAAQAAVAGFAVMSLFNFSIQAIPATCLFIIYAAMLIARHPLRAGSPLPGIVACICLLAAGAWMGFTQGQLAKAHRDNMEAAGLLREKDYTGAVTTLALLDKRLRDSEYFLQNYGRALLATGRYAPALMRFNQAKTLTSDPGLYLLIGNCYAGLRQFDAANAAYSLAGQIVPNRLSPRYHIMKLYLGEKDTINAVRVADELIRMQPKGVSEQTAVYKAEALALKTAIAR